MLDVAISQLTTLRWDLSRELERLAAHGFASLALWRPKVSDAGPAATAAALAAVGVRASSLHWAGGFTGGDGRSFADSMADAVEALETAAVIAGAAPAAPPPVLVLHTGCRGGHTRAHATRLVHDALSALVPLARREGVRLAVKPVHAASPRCGFLSSLDAALDLVAECADPAVGLALDLWHVADDPSLPSHLPRLAAATALVQVADRCGPPAADADRLPAGHGTLRLERFVAALLAHGYRGDFEFDPVGETVEVLGYDGVLRETRLVADVWAERISPAVAAVFRTDDAHDGGPAGTLARAGQSRRPASVGARRSQASSQAVSPG